MRDTIKSITVIALLLTILAWAGCQKTCDKTCLNNGTCNKGVCSCTEGHWGDACEYDSCAQCLNTYTKIYLDAYLDKLDTLTNGFCEDCVNQQDVTLARIQATNKASQLSCMDTTQTPSRVNLSEIIRAKQYEPVSDSFTQDEKDDIIRLNSWLDFNPIASPGYIPVPACK